MREKYDVCELDIELGFCVYSEWQNKCFVQIITNNKPNAELIAKILNDDEKGVSSVYKAWERYRGVDVL